VSADLCVRPVGAATARADSPCTVVAACDAASSARRPGRTLAATARGRPGLLVVNFRPARPTAPFAPRARTVRRGFAP